MARWLGLSLGGVILGRFECPDLASAQAYFRTWPGVVTVTSQLNHEIAQEEANVPEHRRAFTRPGGG